MAEEHPLVGILVSPSLIAGLAGPTMVSNEILHMAAARQAGVRAYLFKLQDVRLKNKRLQGFVYDDQKGWTTAEFPWPDVLYEYGVQRHPRELAPILKELRGSALPINTAHSCGKWQAHHILARFADTVGYLPDTFRYQTPRDLRLMLARHQAIFIKPEWGSCGRGIWRVERTEDGRYRCQSAEAQQLHKPVSFEQVKQRVFTGAKGRRFVVQAEIPLIQREGRRADIRLMMNKNRDGRWEPAASRLRVGKPNSIVTNIYQGAELFYLHDGLPFVLPEYKAMDELTTRIHAAADIILPRLEEGLGAMGEVGLDLALDQDLKVWFLEANLHPNKTPPTPEELERGVPRKYTTIMEYALYLWEQAHRPRPDSGASLAK